ncbi:MAG: hypothetical protein M0008_01225 [Actinomycetota bacterium]|nr:hypothetical protein [Actinomycetota bacterium]
MSTTDEQEFGVTREERLEDGGVAKATFFEKRAKVGVLLLILSDAMMVVSAFGSFVYLHALNTSGAFKPSNEHAPALAGGLIIALLMVLGAVVFRIQIVPSARSGREPGIRSGLSLALLLAIAALVVQLWAAATGSSYPTPVHGYASTMILLEVIGVFHMFLTTVITALLFGRSKRRLLEGRSYPLETAGYWWYYVAGLSVVTWLLVTLI